MFLRMYFPAMVNNAAKKKFDFRENSFSREKLPRIIAYSGGNAQVFPKRRNRYSQTCCSLKVSTIEHEVCSQYKIYRKCQYSQCFQTSSASVSFHTKILLAKMS